MPSRAPSRSIDGHTTSTIIATTPRRRPSATPHRSSAMPMTFRNNIAATDRSTCSGERSLCQHGRPIAAGGLHDPACRERPACLRDAVRRPPPPRRGRNSRAREGLVRSLAGSSTSFLAAHLPQLRNANVVVAAGSAAPRILASAKTLDADLIVLATRGRDLIRRAFLGIGSRGGDPGLGDPGDVDSLRQARSRPDLSADRMRRELHRRVRPHLRSLHRTRVCVRRNVGCGPHSREARCGRRRRGRTAGVWTRNDTISVEPRILVCPQEEPTILLEYLRESGADLVVVGARRRIFQKRTTLGSTTNAITHRARCPVLTVSETPADRE